VVLPKMPQHASPCGVLAGQQSDEDQRDRCGVYADKELRTCKKCGAVLPDPNQLKRNGSASAQAGQTIG
jgi:hypothetical protein